MEHARPPPELSIEGSPAVRAEAWKKWWTQFSVFLKASGVYKEDEDVQASLLVNLIGTEGYEIYQTFTYDKGESADSMKCLKEKFDKHFGSKVNVTMLRFKFFTRNQNVGETINQYVTALKLLSQGCEFETLRDGLIRDRVVCGISNNVVRDRLLRTEDLTLAKAVQICEADEASKADGRQIEQASTSTSVQVDAVRRENRSSSGSGMRGGRRGWRGGRPGRQAAGAQPCASCGSTYCDNAQQCPAANVVCYVCDRPGHYAKVCSKRASVGRVHNVSVVDYNADSEDDVLYVSMIKEHDFIQNKAKEWKEIMDCNGKRITFKLDTGSMLNVLSRSEYELMGLKIRELVPYNKRVHSYTGNTVPILGKCLLNINFKNNKYKLQFLVADMQCQNILGLEACVELGVIQRVDTLNINDYKDLFNGLGELPGKHEIVVDTSVKPVICPVRRIPLGMRDKLKNELVRMEQLGVVRKVNHPTPWVNAIVIAPKKNGDIRVCLDPLFLNRAVRRAHFAFPTVSELAAQLRGARYFSVLDARCGFWMLKLDDASADLCTFNTPFGRYQFLRLPYGISCAPEMFHAKVRQYLEDLEGTESFIDDIIVWGSTKEEHDQRLQRLLQRAKEIGIRFNKEKCKFGVNEIKYLGHVFDQCGMRPDEEKIKAIMDMPDPTDRRSLERFLGMVNYLSKFISNYSECVAVLRSLLKKDVEWVWDQQHSAAVKTLKQKISSAPVLALYSKETPIILSVDASSEALGAVLLQNDRPVEFASLTLTATQRRYAQIEKEMLAIVFACERFRQYVFGRQDVTVQTDHKPLEAIFKKSLTAVPARLQRMMLRLQGFSFKVTYTPGKYMYIADTLSRAALPELMHERISEEVEAQTCFILENAQFSDEKMELVKQQTARDQQCNMLIKYIQEGWPRSRYDVDNNLKTFWPYRENMHYIDGIILKNNRVYIPFNLRAEMLKRIHEGHLGIDRCKRRARDVMFWPNMTRDIEDTVRECSACALLASRPPAEPMMPHAVPDVPWYKLGSDIFEYKKKYFLVLVDYFSNFVEVNELGSINSRSVIKALKEQFARHGIPKELVTDNGPAYSSREFKKFLSDWEISHITSSPMYPQSNDTHLVSITPRRVLDEPQFEKPIGNHTFHIGREAMLGCSVVNLGKHKVGWLRAEDQTVLSLHERVVLAGRYSVSLDPPRTWQLRIRPLRAEDRGCYMCQINTQPSMKWQIGCIDVYVPPDIINEETSADVSAHELDNVTLVCRASGHPPPKITWRREDHGPMLLKKIGSRDFYKVDSYVGSSLPLWRVDRRQMGAFLCIASNDVPPAVSKRITLLVNFSPTVIVPNQLLGSPLGADVVLECTIEAHPNTINYWLKNRGEMLLDGPKYTITEKRSSYKVQMTLTIRKFARSDIGTYNCVSTNSLGKSEGTLRLYEIKLFPSSQSSAEANMVGPTDEAVKLKSALSAANSVMSMISKTYQAINFLVVVAIFY